MVAQPSIRLPKGVRDFLPRATARRREIAGHLVREFERWGYRRVITPQFECNDVLERGLGENGRKAVLRFVEPGSGEIVALRPDITPQIARMVATRLADIEGPLRLCYQGAVTRLNLGVTQPREILQAGVELVNAESPHGDAELIAVAASALAHSGMEHIRLDVGHVGISRQALERIEDVARRALVRDLINKKDQAGVAKAVADLPKSQRILLEALPDLYGPPKEVLARAGRLPLAPENRDALSMVEQLLSNTEGLIDPELHARLGVDLGDVRGFEYYTGLWFRGFVEGYGGAVLRGGRYDNLIARYGHDTHATGFAVDIEAIAQAQRKRGVDMGRLEDAVVISVRKEAQRVVGARIAASLRAQGVRVALDPRPFPGVISLCQHAEAVGFSRVVVIGARKAGSSTGGELVRIPTNVNAPVIEPLPTKVLDAAVQGRPKSLFHLLAVTQQKGN